MFLKIKALQGLRGKKVDKLLTFTEIATSSRMTNNPECFLENRAPSCFFDISVVSGSFCCFTPFRLNILGLRLLVQFCSICHLHNILVDMVIQPDLTTLFFLYFMSTSTVAYKYSSVEIYINYVIYTCVVLI